MMTRKAVPVQPLCVPGFGACSEPRVAAESGVVRIMFLFPSAEEDFNRGVVTFQGVLAYRWTAEVAMAEYIEGAYSTVAELPDSHWLSEVQRATRDKQTVATVLSGEGLHHYVVFFDDYGCYEILAQSFDIQHAGT